MRGQGKAGGAEDEPVTPEGLRGQMLEGDPIESIGLDRRQGHPPSVSRTGESIACFSGRAA
jgi:hypothetical protein